MFTCIPIVVSRNGGKIQIGSTARKVNPLNETALRNGECELCTVVDAQCQCSIAVFENTRWCTIVVITERHAAAYAVGVILFQIEVRDLVQTTHVKPHGFEACGGVENERFGHGVIGVDRYG